MPVCAGWCASRWQSQPAAGMLSLSLAAGRALLGGRTRVAQPRGRPQCLAMTPPAPTPAPGWRRMNQAPGTWSIPQDTPTQCHFALVVTFFCCHYPGTLCEPLVLQPCSPLGVTTQPGTAHVPTCPRQMGHGDCDAVPAARDAAAAPLLHSHQSCIVWHSRETPRHPDLAHTPLGLTAPQLPALGGQGEDNGGLLPAQRSPCLQWGRHGGFTCTGQRQCCSAAPCRSACTKRCLLERGRPRLCGRC